MPEIESSWMEGFYSYFFSRDLVYIFAGGLFISILEYALLGKIDFPQQISLELIGLLAICYVVGFVLNNIAQRNIKKYSIDTLYKPPYNYKSYLVIYQDLIDIYDKRIINLLERFTYQMVLGYSVGAASLFGGAVMLIVVIGRFLIEKINPVYNVSLAIILLVFGGFMLFLGKDSYIEAQFHEVFLIDGIKSRKK